MAFKAHILSTGSETSIVCTGPMDEHMDIPKVPVGPLIRVDLQQVTYINSIGIRKWIRWVQAMQAHSKIILENCPAIFVKNIATIKGMVMPNISIQSFYVPYYCDETGERQNVLFRLGMEFYEDGRVSPPKINESSPHPMEIDVVEDIYFSFLKR